MNTATLTGVRVFGQGSKWDPITGTLVPQSGPDSFALRWTGVPPFMTCQVAIVGGGPLINIGGNGWPGAGATGAGIGMGPDLVWVYQTPTYQNLQLGPNPVSYFITNGVDPKTGRIISVLIPCTATVTFFDNRGVAARASTVIQPSAVA